MVASDGDLGRGQLGSVYAGQIVDRIAGGGASATFGVVGAWGSGKSWLLDAILRELSEHPNWGATNCTVVRFNPWYYSDEQALFAGFAHLLVQGALERKKGRKRLADLLRWVGPAAKFGPVDISEFLTNMGDGLSGTAPTQISKEVEAGLKASNRQLLIVMDDLDRLTPDELLVLFKLIRLIGEVPGLHYLLAYDEDTLHHLLMQTSIAADSADRARRYLEKIVERRWEVPPMTDRHLDEVLFSKLRLVEADRNDPGLGYRLEGVFRSVITTPRSAERYVDLAGMVPDRVRQQLHQGDLHLSLLLRHAAPAVWKLIVQERSFLVSRESGLLSAKDRDSRVESLQAKIRSVAGELSGNEDLFMLLEQSFPGLQFTKSLAGRGEWDAHRIGHPDFIDHFLWLDLPPGSVPELAILTALQGLPGAGAEGEIRSWLAAAPRLTFEAIGRNFEGSGVKKTEVIGLLARLLGSHGIDATIGAFGISIDRRILTIAEEVLLRMPTNELDELLQNESLLKTRMMAELVVALHLRPKNHYHELMRFVDDAIPPLTSILTKRLSVLNSDALLLENNRLDFLILARIATDELRSLVAQSLENDHWKAGNIVALYLGIRSDAEERSWYLDLRHLREDLGEDLVGMISTQLRSEFGDPQTAEGVGDFPVDNEELPPAERSEIARQLFLIPEPELLDFTAGLDEAIG